jgi:hypothetical protein
MRKGDSNSVTQQNWCLPIFCAPKKYLYESTALGAVFGFAHIFIHRKCAELVLPSSWQHVTLRNSIPIVFF